MLNKFIAYAFAASLLAVVDLAAASDECVLTIPAGSPTTSAGAPIAIIASGSGATQQCASLPYQQSAALQAMAQGTVAITGGDDPVGDGRAGCHTTLGLNTQSPDTALPYATIEEYPHDINATLGLVASQWNQNWALNSWNAVQIKASVGNDTFNALTIQLRRTEVGQMLGESIRSVGNDSPSFATNLEVLDVHGTPLRVLANINTAQLLQLRINTTVDGKVKQLRLALSAADLNPTIINFSSDTVLTLRYGVNAELAANATTGARGWLSVFPCVGGTIEF